MQYTVYDLTQTRTVARMLIKAFGEMSSRTNALVVGLDGELGAGKTAFVRELVGELGGSSHVTSPTFVIMQTFPIINDFIPFKNIIHIDAYRIEDAEELSVLSWEQLCTDPQNVIFIEWPEQVKEILPKDTPYITFELQEDGARQITLPERLLPASPQV